MQISKPARLVTTLALGAFILLVPSLRAEGKDGREDHSHDSGEQHRSSSHEHSSSANPLVEEMNTLDAAFREIISAVSLGDGPRVHRALEPMHGTMEKTHEGVHHGTVKLRKNADQLEAFVRMDKEFHGELEKLAGAAKKNDRNAMLSITQGMLGGCVSCHNQYRP